jgi:signal transduction histidine kinase
LRHAVDQAGDGRRDGPDDAALKEVSRNIDPLVRAPGNLLNGLLDLSRLSSGHFVPDRTVFALERTAADVCDEMAGAAQTTRLALVSRLGSVRVESDPTAVGRILRDLVDNAIKYTDHGTITVTVEAVDGRARVSVADTGRGIPRSEQARILEEFRQLDNASRDRSTGVGLGLAIVNRLAELLDARIDVESEPDIQRSMRTLLEVWGLETRAFGSAAELEAALDGSPAPQLLIADPRLGGDEHGAALAQRLGRRHPGMGVPILTGETSSEALRGAVAMALASPPATC